MTDTRSRPGPNTPDGPSTDPAWERLEDQINWYDDSSTKNKNWFISLKIVQLVAAAAVPVMASIQAAVWVTGGLGALVVVVEGIQQLGQYQANWINYRSTAEALNHEKFLYLSDAGQYHGVADQQRLLAERTEALISSENAKWTSGRQRSADQDHGQTGRGAKSKP